MKHTDIKKLFAESEAFVGTSVVICGWVRTARDSKNVSFMEVNDGSCFRNLQLVIHFIIDPLFPPRIHTTVNVFNSSKIS